jgi:hypothetical protein
MRYLPSCVCLAAVGPTALSQSPPLVPFPIPVPLLRRSKDVDVAVRDATVDSPAAVASLRQQLTTAATPANPSSLRVLDADGDGDLDVVFSPRPGGASLLWCQSRLLVTVAVGGPGADDGACGRQAPGVPPCATFDRALRLLFGAPGLGAQVRLAAGAFAVGAPVAVGVDVRQKRPLVVAGAGMGVTRLLCDLTEWCVRAGAAHGRVC